MTWWVSLYSVVLCCILLYCVVLCCTVLYYVVLCCILLYCVVLCCTVLYYVVLCCIMLSYVVFCCAVLYSVILCCILFCCTVLFSFWPLSSPHLTVNDLVNIIVYSVMLCRAHADHRICRFLRFLKKKCDTFSENATGRFRILQHRSPSWILTTPLIEAIWQQVKPLGIYLCTLSHEKQ